MSEQQGNQNQVIPADEKFKNIIERVDVRERFERMLGDPAKASSFLLSVLNCVQNNYQLQKAEPNSILMASAVAGTMDLPVDPSLGMAYIIPYNTKVGNAWITKAQFQIGYKGLIELGHRSQQYKGLNVEDVREGEFKGIDRLTGRMNWDWIQDNDERNEQPVVGYVAFFELINGFSKALYMTNKEVERHAKKYSKSFDSGQWTKDFSGMAKKTVLKRVIDKWGPKSVSMRKAIKADQGVIHDWDGDFVSYPDNPLNEKPKSVDEVNAERHRENAIRHIRVSTSCEQLEQVYEHIPDDDVRKLYDEKMAELTANK